MSEDKMVDAITKLLEAGGDEAIRAIIVWRGIDLLDTVVRLGAIAIMFIFGMPYVIKAIAKAVNGATDDTA